MRHRVQAPTFRWHCPTRIYLFLVAVGTLDDQRPYRDRRLYGLTRDELRYTRLGRRHWRRLPSRTFRILRNNETRHFGVYRTRRLVLEA